MSVRRLGLILVPLLLALPAAAQGDAAARARDANERAVARFNAGDAEGALPLLREARGLAPDDARIRENLGRCLLTTGDAHRAAHRLADAARDYHEAVGLLPDEPEAGLREALALQEALRDREAVVVLEPLLRRWPDQAVGHELNARSLDRLGETVKALAAWERVLTLTPTHPTAATQIERLLRAAPVEEGLAVDLGAAHFTIRVDGATDAALGRRVATLLEEAYRDVGSLLGRYPNTEVAVVIYPGKTFQAVTGAHGWVAGLFDGRIRVPAAGLNEASDAEVRRVLVHEYAHALVRAIGGAKVPVWLHEGIAQLAEGRSRSDARAVLATAAAAGFSPTLADLERSFSAQADATRVRVLYAGAYDLVCHLAAQGNPLLADLLERLGKDEPLADALRATHGLTPAELEAAWRATLAGGR